MKRIIPLFLFSSLLATAVAQDQSARQIYADFEQLDKDKRPISARGGKVIFSVTAQNENNKPVIAAKMMGASPPLTQRIAFEFDIKQPNLWASAYVKVLGFKDRGYTAGEVWERMLLAKAEDLSAYQYITLEIGAVGANQVRIDLISEGNGIDTNAYPGLFLNLTNQLQAYRIPVKDFKQPEGEWVKKKTTVQEIMKKLTAVQINVTSVPAKGMVVLDNLAFER